MKRSLFTSLSPNLEWDDAFLAWRLLFSPWHWRSGQTVQELEKRIGKDFGAEYTVTFESGRTSLTALLTTSSLRPGDEVALQAYTCVAVPNAIIWAGFKPLFIDCNQSTLTISPGDLEKKITTKTKALIIQHTFGQVGDLEKVIEIARRHQLIVIEDCAHVIGGRYEDRLLGTWGDASFMSFGRDKAISGVFGGLALTRHDAWGRRLREKQRSYPLPKRLWIVQQLLHPIITFKAKLLYDFGGLGRGIFSLAKKIKLLSKTVEPIERLSGQPSFAFHQMPNALAMLTLHQYEKLDRFNQHRREIAKRYTVTLEKERKNEPVKEDPVFPLRFVIQVAEPKKLIARAKEERIYLGDWYSTPIAPVGIDYTKIGYRSGSCPNAEAVAKRSVNLPTNIHVTAEDADRIIIIVKPYIKT